MFRSKFLCVLLGSVLFGQICHAQGPLDKKRDAIRRAAANRDSDNDSNDRRNDFEGVVWEFKVMDRKEKDKSKQTKMKGRFRIKQSAVFAVGDVKLFDGTQTDAKSDAEEETPAKDEKGKVRDLIKQRMRQTNRDEPGDERIGDFSRNSAKEYVIMFDQDDEHPLSGRAELKPDSKSKGGFWFGKYVQYLDGNSRKSWRMEIRKIDE